MSYKPHERRVIEEQAELSARIAALGKFLYTTPVFQGLDEVDQRLLVTQHKHMLDYDHILIQRISRFSTP